MNEHILVVDDDQEIRKLIQIYLENDGYICHMAKDGAQALELIKSQPIELMVLDVMMPKIDGLTVCQEVRKEKNIPIIMVSAKTQDTDKIYGLTSGADDYMTKPFSPLELLARIKSQLRRFKVLNNTEGMNASQTEIAIDGLYINTATHEVKVNGKAVKLTPREFDILLLLAKNKGVVFSTDKIYETVWEEDPFETRNTVMVHIRKIREKIEANPRSPEYVKTVWGVGYKI
ncbi:response regulator transcription factor [Fusibacter sp. JL216-2]|uniref:response regulator transcription factor n=1 Tax=Fusibacter sp. JL216-2 TaxID=3071453 RepID=UPI003D33724B